MGEYFSDRGTYILENKEKVEKLEKDKRKTLSFTSLNLNSALLEEEPIPVNILQAAKGFVKPFLISVLKSDTCYNDDFKPYKVLFIDKCLVDVS